MIAPGRATGTLFESAEGDAIGGRLGETPSALSDLSSSLDGFGLASTGWLFPGTFFGVGEGVGDDSVFFSSLSSPNLPFSSSASLPTSLEVVIPTSFSAAKTDAPRTVITVPPFDVKSFRVETPPPPNSDIYRP